MEKRYAGKSPHTMLADYYRNLIQEVASYKRNELQKEVLNVIKIKHLFSHFWGVLARSYFHTAFLPLFLNSNMNM
jgi:hypothetical protein